MGAVAGGPGLCAVLGVTEGSGGGVNFCVYSKHASEVSLCLWLPGGGSSSGKPSAEVACSREGDRWSVNVTGVPKAGVVYGYRVKGPSGPEHRFDPSQVFLDPYAKAVTGPRYFNEPADRSGASGPPPFLGTYDLERKPYDWGAGYKRPGVRWEDLVIYEMGVRNFTADPSAATKAQGGTYKALAEKVPHLVSMGVNAVELLPVYVYDEREFTRFPNPRDHMVNAWGYSTINFFAPMPRFSEGGDPVGAIDEFKDMVKALHAAGIEVILDVVYNHTAEQDDRTPYPVSFRGIDSKSYYMTSPEGHLLNLAGCGNTVSCNKDPGFSLVMDSLRYWVEEMHVDGFRFDLASVLCRDDNGAPIDAPPVIRAIAKDPVLSKVKLISEPWDCGGLYQVGSFPNWDVWAEWNGKYRDDVRRFIKGDDGCKPGFATRICGSSDLYRTNGRKPYHSINFVVAHDGFSLYDLVSYNGKHNGANGEDGRDGSNDNESWNCGAEGETGDPGVNALRWRQMRNFTLALLASQGTPMLLMGDEYGHTGFGNNNRYGHDNHLNHFLWDRLDGEKEAAFKRFTAELTKFRTAHPLLGRPDFMGEGDITFFEDNWDNAGSHYLAFRLNGCNGTPGRGDLFFAFNAHGFEIPTPLPPLPGGKQWHRVVDTNLGPGKDFSSPARALDNGVYGVAGFSAIMLEALP